MITATLVGATSPQLVQVNVSSVPDGETWLLTGVAGAFSWVVPGGQGVGDGGQVVLVDNGAPLNVEVTYALTTDVGVETSAPIVIPHTDGDMVIQSLNGQRSVSVLLLDETQDVQMDDSLALFTVPGRRQPVSRYSAMGERRGTIRMRLDVDRTPDLDAVLAPGEPVLCRLAITAFDIPPVQVVHISKPSATGFLVGLYRHWELPYVPVANPYMDQRLGAFTWDYIGALQKVGSTVRRSGDVMEAIMAGRTWDQVDAFDWSVLE
ncbi:hypothetical protein OR221_0865 [Microbacterium laevaniformans OR221]|nr:hypothetical protein OR221_0865 [Microbacterium laevaniformans OR221]